MDIRHALNIVTLTEAVVTAYHGSQSAQPDFKMGHTGQNSHTFGHYQSTRWGVFFTDNPDFARMYGEVGQYTLNLTHTLDLGKDRGDTIYEFIQMMQESDVEDARGIWLDARNVLHGTWHYWHLFENELGKYWTAFLKEKGYDSVVFYEANEDDDGNEHESRTIVVLEPERIKRATAPSS